MLAFKINDTLFTLRTAAVIINRDRILLHKAEGNDFWSLPGGRVEPMESSADALIREMNEELHVVVHICRLLWIAEYFYKNGSQKNHEIGFYYLVELPEDSSLLDFSRTYSSQDGNIRLSFRWHLLRSLSSTTLYPAFLKKTVLFLPEKPEYIIFTDPSLKT